MTLGSLFTDNMLLQREVAISVWGNGSPGEPLSVAFAGQVRHGVTGPDGTWNIQLDPLETCSDPRDLTITSNITIVLRNVLVGEVWLCSGQSNMELKVSAANDAQKEIGEANFPAIRLFHVPQIPSNTPLSEIQGARWQECSPHTVGSFSAVAYYFGRELYRKLGIPIGLIDASWGGTKAEFWTSLESLRKIPAISPAIATRAARLEYSKQHSKPGLYSLPAECTADVRNAGYSLGWADLPDPHGDWQEISLPAQWQQRGLDFSGILWFRKSITLPPEWVGRELKLSIGAVDKCDTTYFNNIKVGGFGIDVDPLAYRINREYAVDGKLTRTGTNILVVRVHSGLFDGGLTGPAEVMSLSCPSLETASEIRLDVIWKYAVECNYGLRNCDFASELFNGMISPLTPFALRGVVWYQGESNNSAPHLYHEILTCLILDWRTHWNLGDFPFLIVQLPNCGGSGSYEETAWAKLRDAQRRAGELPNVEVVTTIDLGDPADIHGKNKQEVGYRVALNALANVYGHNIEWSGPVFASARVEDNAMRIHFTEIGGRLSTKGEAPLKGFVICGADRKFVSADAKIENAEILASSPEVKAPLAVRYAWADNPDANLINSAGLPAAPFRTDCFDNFGEGQ